MTARKTELEEQLTNANEDISSLQSELNITDSNLQQAYDDIKSLQARRSELEHLLQTEQTNVANLTSELETANADIESKQNEISSLTNQLSEKENQIEILTAEKLELEETIAEKDARIEELGVKISNLENSVVKDFGKFNYYVEGGKSYYMHMLDNGNLFMSNNGLYLYDFYDATFTEIIPDNVNFNKFYQSGDELLVITTSSQYVVNINTLEATKIGTYADTAFTNFFTMNDGCVVVYGNKYLVYVYNPADKTFVTIEDDLYRPTFVAKQIYEDRLFLYGSSFFAVYNNNTKTITQLIDGYNGMSSVFKLSNNNALITSTQVNGLWLYDYQANTVTTITTDSFANHDYMFETPTGHVICASLISNSYIGLYNINTGETSKFTPSSAEYTTGYNHFIEDENGVTITRNDGKDCDEIYFDYNTLTFTEL